MYNYFLNQRINSKAKQVCRMREKLEKQEMELHRLIASQESIKKSFI